MPQIDELRALEEMDLPGDRTAQPFRILEDAIEAHDPSHVFAMFSGGHDSLCATHLTSQLTRFTGAAHINTGIGIEETREYVRRTCRERGWDLYEKHATDPTYEELVLEKGFPRGQASHNAMLYYLKQQQWNRLVAEHKRGWHGRPKRFDRIMLVTGIRRSESNRRMGREMSEPWTRKGSQVWVNPILLWDEQDKASYMDQHTLPRNPVVDHLHRSGECLCGALANHREIEEIEFFYPEAAERIHGLERKCEQKGLVDCRWAYPSQAPGKTWDDVHPSEVDLQLCMDCIGRTYKPEPTI